MKRGDNPSMNGDPGRDHKLVSTDNFFRKILDSLPEGIQIIDFDWRYVYINEALASYDTRPKEKLLSQCLLEIYPEIKSEPFFTELEACMLQRRKGQIEVEFACPNESKKWFQLTIHPVPEGLMVFSLDISQRIEAEERMERLNQLYFFISQVNQKIVRVKDEATLFLNACRMAIKFGKFKMAWIGMFDSNLPQNISMVQHSGIDDDDIDQFRDAMLGFPFPQECVLRSGSHYICGDIEHDADMAGWSPYASKYGIRSCIVLPIKSALGVIGTFNLYATEPDFASDEEIALLVEVTSDISFALDLFEKERILNEVRLEQKQAEVRLVENMEELRKTNAELDRFVYSASHDLRAPLSSVLGLISLVEMGSKEAETLTYAKMIRNSVKRLEGFIQNILSYSKNNRLELEITIIPIENKIEEIIGSLQHSKEADGVVFEIRIDAVEPFYSDIHRVTILLENLISNAIKFQNYERFDRVITIVGSTDKENLHLKVIDNGIGIDAEHQSKVFDMFFRASAEREGSGIGLYIVKETVTKLQGTISVQSEKFTGTTFSVQLKNFTPYNTYQ